MDFNAVVEGTSWDDGRLYYDVVKSYVPQNAQVLALMDGHMSRKFILHARTRDFNSMAIQHSPYFSCDPRDFNYELIEENGWPLIEDPAIWDLFEDPRSIVVKTRDSFDLYVDLAHFHENWRFYLDALPKVLRASENIFSGKKSAKQINSKPKRCI